MKLHPQTFDAVLPTDTQLDLMEQSRSAAKEYADRLELLLPEGPDKTYLMRKLRECAMWAIVCITREADGSPRNATTK